MIEPKVIETIGGLRAAIGDRQPSLVGLVPTMGALHKGHAALIERAQRDCDLVVVSIFVNPLQFGPHEDYRAYPRDLRADAGAATLAGADIIFAPTAAEMLTDSILTSIKVAELSESMCGRYRGGHFEGVATIVAKLFNIVRPKKAYFGEKDWQQLQVVRQMVRDLSFDIEIVAIPTVRDSDGLAISSRNKYLTPDEREAALALPRALGAARLMVEEGETEVSNLKSSVKDMIAAQPGVELEYFFVGKPDSLQDIEQISGDVLLAAAVYVGRTRLIDNVVIWS
jgi:pantoate--beta-alanine ligase